MDITQPQSQSLQDPHVEAPIEEELSDFWADLEGDDLGAAVLSRFTSFKEWCRDNGLIRGWYLKLSYYHNEYRANPVNPHLAVMQEFGAQGENFFVSINHLRSVLKTILGSVIQNPPSFQCRSVNTDSDAKEMAALYNGVLDYYKRQLRFDQKLNKAAEIGICVDQAYLMCEWDFFASGAQDPGDGIWKGDISLKVLYPWDVAYDITKTSWSDLDWVIVRDWVPRQKVKAMFPEFADDIKGVKNRADIMMANRDLEGATRYQTFNSTELSEDIQVFKLFYRDVPWMPGGNFAMFLENGKMLYESPTGLMYPRLPVERFVPDEQVDILLGYSPCCELLGIQESINTVASSILSNSINYANQYICASQGTELNPKVLDGSGHKIIEFPVGSPAPAGINFTQIPEALFQHLESLIGYMNVLPGVSNVSRGEVPGANSTGSAMLFSASQTSQNAGNMTQNYNDFASNVMTLLLHTLRVFGRTQRTIQVMGSTVASQTIVLADALKGFDEVVVDLGNPALNTPQGKLGMATSLMQYGDATPQQILEVATSGNLNAATDPARETQYELDKENEWLLAGDQVLVFATDDHEQHVMQHSRLLSRPEFRNPRLAQQLGIQNAPQLVQGVMAHIQQHMEMLAQNHANTATGQVPGAPQKKGSPALGQVGTHTAQANPSADVGVQNSAQGGGGGAAQLPSQPSTPSPPQ